MTAGCSRRGALTLLLAAGTLSACGKTVTDDVLRVGSQRGGTKAMMLASAMLADAGYRVEWSEFPAAQNLLEALGAQAVDLGTVGDAPFLFAYEGGKPIKVVQATRFVPRNVANAILVPGHSVITDIGGLRGRKVATGRGSIGHFLLLRALERANIGSRDIDIIFLPPGDAKAAFEARAVDAWAAWNPYVGAALLHDGARVLVDGRRVIEGYGFLVAAEQAISDKAAILSDFLKRHARAQKWASDHPDAYGEVLARETGLPLGDARYLADRAMDVVPIDDKLLAIQRGVLQTFVAANAATGQRPIRDGFDDRFDKPA